MFFHLIHTLTSRSRFTAQVIFIQYERSAIASQIYECRIPALMSTLWAVGCQLRRPTRLEWPSSLTTGSVSGKVSPPSGISQIYPIAKRANTSAEHAGRTWPRVWCGSAYHHAAVLRAAGNDVVVVRTKFDVQDRPRVSAHSGVGHVDAPRLQREIVTLMRPFLLTYVCSPAKYSHFLLLET